MKRLLGALVALLVVAGVVALFAARSTFSDEKEREAGPTATATTVRKIDYMGTDGIVRNIERRLESTSGQALSVRCPRKVDEAVGTTFRCSIRPAGEKDRIGVATVTIDGERGRFRWKSEALPSADDETEPAP